MWLQNQSDGLQKSGKVVCWIPVLFRFMTSAATETTLLIAYAKVYCNFSPNNAGSE
jgi:hypothetical protein